MLTIRLTDVAPPEPDGGSGTSVLLLLAGIALVAGAVTLAIVRYRRSQESGGRGPTDGSGGRRSPEEGDGPR
ncbi:hypothetical protein MTQ01_11785 [Streptomyces sp. XM4193]|uniref:hypothetical protein n=1 Tax=Streptomyces sp. XM4193 TaxID=2929782 RepID=UPI001FFC245C|nr:hypothetical protein [Streptomyces sp. XM4193]MCK1796684.1 hypothetical protein [Streptomyces sp. XM4193]